MFCFISIASRLLCLEFIIILKLDTFLILLILINLYHLIFHNFYLVSCTKTTIAPRQGLVLGIPGTCTGSSFH
eukprot:SAG11_NODE_1352_length_5131_cov_19.593402_2_plen_73_part_00